MSKTEAISVRVETELKREFFKHLEKRSMTFSKWIRNAMRKELEDLKDKKK